MNIFKQKKEANIQYYASKKYLSGLSLFDKKLKGHSKAITNRLLHQDLEG